MFKILPLSLLVWAAPSLALDPNIDQLRKEINNLWCMRHGDLLLREFPDIDLKMAKELKTVETMVSSMAEYGRGEPNCVDAQARETLVKALNKVREKKDLFLFFALNQKDEGTGLPMDVWVVHDLTTKEVVTFWFSFPVPEFWHLL